MLKNATGESKSVTLRVLSKKEKKREETQSVT